MLEEGGKCDWGCGHRQAATLVDSNTLYSAQECLNRRALDRVPATETLLQALL